MTVPIFGIIFAIGGPILLVGFIFYYYFKTRNSERLSLIEKGLDPSFLYAKKGPDYNGFPILRYGLLFIGAGLGTVFGYLLIALTPFPDGAAYASMILLFGGGSLILSYFIEQKKVEAKKYKEN